MTANADQTSTTSAVWRERARRSLAAGVGSFARGIGAGYAQPIVIESAEGALIRDVDGREYIDFLLALGPLILGHRPAILRQAVDAALDRYGSMVGLSNELEVLAAEAVTRVVPSVDLVRFSNSGTEATMMAVRMARAVTGRPVVVKFEGHFHGWSDSLHWSVKPPLSEAGDPAILTPVPAVRGLPAALSSSLIVLPWNDLSLVERTFAERGPEIAAIITEPMMANLGCIEAAPGFLAGLREITTRAGAILIFDEVVTGFRLALGGAQALYGVTPDLTAMAKALGGGYAVSALGGSAEAMEVVTGGDLPYLGTYNTSPVAMAAVAATIEALEAPGTYERLDRLGRRLSGGLKMAFQASSIPATVLGTGSVFQVWFTNEPPTNYREAVAAARPDFYRAFHQAMLKRGVLFHPSQYEHFFVSTAHTNDLVDRALDAAHDAIPEIAARFA